MRFLSSFGLLLSLGISGCFLSGTGDGAECTAPPTCPEGTTSGCAPDSPDCELFLVCGEMLYCGLPTAQCGAVPVCAAEEIEVPSCEPGSASCHPLEVCASTIFCDLCDLSDVCEGDILRTEPCDDEGPACRRVEVCGEDIYCVSPTGECSSGVQVSGPEECDPDGTCFFEDYGESRVWCTGSVPECFAFPVCRRGEQVLDLLDPCPGSSECHYVTLCGLTVQCAAPLDVDG